MIESFTKALREGPADALNYGTKVMVVVMVMVRVRVRVRDRVRNPNCALSLSPQLKLQT
jgi:hypothetical protein